MRAGAATAFLACAAAAWASPGRAAGPPAASPAPLLVRIDVVAADAAGRRVTNLRPGDFAVRDDGQPRTLESVRFVQPAGVGESRLFGIFLDEYHVDRASTDRVRTALTAFVDQELGPNDRAVVMKPLDSLFSIELTSDRDALRRAIAGFEGREGDYEPRNAYERDYMAATPGRIEPARTQIAVSAINALAVRLGALSEERKTLIVVSDGIPPPERARRTGPLPTFDTIVRSANRSNVAIYVLDPREGAPPAVPSDALRALAAETDGRAVANDLDGGLRRAADDAGSYYLLTFRSAHPEDGRFHEVHVDVARAGVSVRARRGYFAPSVDEVMRAALLARLNAPRPPAPVEPAPHASPFIRPWFGFARGSEGKTQVTFVWEPAGAVPGARGGREASMLTLTALAPDGTVLFKGPVRPTGPGAGEETGAAPAEATFEMAPGRLRLRMAIEDAASQPLDRDVRDLAIRPIGSGISIATPQVLRARTAREFRALDDPAAVPVASRMFSRTEQLLIRFRVYAPDGARPALSARLLNRMAQPMRALAVASAAAPDGFNQIDLPLASLAPADYMVEISASVGGHDTTERMAFRVTF